MSAGRSATLDRFLAAARRRLRLRRSAAAALLVVGLISLASILMAAPLLAGFGPGLSPGRWWIAAAAALVAIAAAGAPLLPVRDREMARRIDRRLGLDAALLTALEVRGSADPVCRLLLTRTQNALASVPVRAAVSLRPPAAALLIPALLVLASGLSLKAAAQAQGTGPAAAGASLAEAERLSGRIQAAAARIVLSDAWAPREIPQIGKRLLAIDEALRRGALSPREAEAALSNLMEDLGQHPPPDARAQTEAGRAGTHGAGAPEPGPEEAPGERSDARRSALAALVEILQSPDAGSEGSTMDRSAGRGRAALDTGEAAAASPDVDPSRASAAWRLPAAADPAPRAGSGRFSGPRRRSPSFMATPPEEALAGRYFDSLQRRGGAAQGSRGDGSGGRLLDVQAGGAVTPMKEKRP